MQTHALIFIQDLAIIMLVAGLITIFCHRFKQPVVFGYIVAGIIMSQRTPPFALISDEETVKTLAELGVIFLMFSLGLEFNLPKLSKVGPAALIAAIAEITLMIWLGYDIGRMFGWSYINAIFLGSILAISSTTIIVKALDELGLKRERFAQLIFGVLIIEDIFAILILALLSSIATSGSLEVKAIINTATQLASFLVVSLLLGILLIPRLLSYVAKFHSEEMLLITTLALCFGFCLLVLKLEYSVALGAFIIGAIIAESNQLKTIETLINPIRDMFSAIFFVSVGLLFDPTVLVEYFLPIVVITIAVIIGKILSCSLGLLLAGRDGKTSMRVGMGLAQIGEFSFIIASLGITLGVTGNFLYSIAVAVSIITTITTPFLIKYSDACTRQIAKLIPKKIANTFGLYVTWIKNIQPEEGQVALTKIVQRNLIHILVNILIVTGIFLSGAYVAKSNFGDYLIQVVNLYMQKTIICTVTLLVSLPFLIAIYRKIKALSMLLAELSVKESADTRFPLRVRAIIAEVIPIISMIVIMMFVFLLSASILPPVELLVVVLIFAIILVLLLSRWFIKLHARLQASLVETLKKEETTESSKRPKK